MTQQTMDWDDEKLLNRLPSPDGPAVTDNAAHIFGLMRRHMPLDAHTQVLEVGCGWGCFTVHFDRCCTVHGIDSSEKMLRVNPIKSTSLMDAAQMEFTDNSFDIAFCRNILHHAPDVDQVIREMRRVSRRYVVLIEPNRNNLFNLLMVLMMKNERGIMQFSPGLMRQMADRCNLQVRDALSYGVLMAEMTPAALVPLKRLTDFRQPFGLESVMIAEKV